MPDSRYQRRVLHWIIHILRATTSSFYPSDGLQNVKFKGLTGFDWLEVSTLGFQCLVLVWTPCKRELSLLAFRRVVPSTTYLSRVLMRLP